MDWDQFDQARALLREGQRQRAITILRELRRRHLHPAIAPLLGQALRQAGDRQDAERVLAEDCDLGIADHWTWLARAEIAADLELQERASGMRARAYELLGWPDCAERGYHFDSDRICQQLPRWSRVFALLVQPGPLAVLSLHGGPGDFALWALERLAIRGGRLTIHGPFAAAFQRNLEHGGPSQEQLEWLNSPPGESDGPWQVIHLGPGCRPEDGWQERLRSRLQPSGVMLADDPACLSGGEMLLPGLLLAGWHQANGQPSPSAPAQAMSS